MADVLGMIGAPGGGKVGRLGEAGGVVPSVLAVAGAVLGVLRVVGGVPGVLPVLRIAGGGIGVGVPGVGEDGGRVSLSWPLKLN